MSANAITVKDVTKVYRLYDKPIDRLKESLSLTHKSYHKDFLCLKWSVLQRGKRTDGGHYRNERFR